MRKRSLQGLLESTKIGAATHFFLRLALNLNKNTDNRIFLKKEENDISSQIFLEFTFTYSKAYTFIKILKLHGKWYHDNHFKYVFNNKIVAMYSAFSMFDRLSLVQLNYSLHTFCSQPETSQLLNKLATFIS